MKIKTFVEFLKCRNNTKYTKKQNTSMSLHNYFYSVYTHTHRNRLLFFTNIHTVIYLLIMPNMYSFVSYNYYDAVLFNLTN